MTTRPEQSETIIEISRPAHCNPFNGTACPEAYVRRDGNCVHARAFIAASEAMSTADSVQPKHPHPNGGSCWTHSACEAREALDKLRSHMRRNHPDSLADWTPFFDRLSDSLGIDA